MSIREISTGGVCLRSDVISKIGSLDMGRSDKSATRAKVSSIPHATGSYPKNVKDSLLRHSSEVVA